MSLSALALAPPEPRESFPAAKPSAKIAAPVGLSTFREIYDAHFAFVWRSLRRLGIPESETADCAQEVFLVVARKHQEFEQRSKLTTWLYGICFRVAKDRRQLRAAKRARATEELDSEGHDAGVDASEPAERRQAAKLLDSILDAMPLEQRAVFTLFELEGCSGQEIAELLELPPGTVASRLRLARECFRREVERLRAKEQHGEALLSVRGTP